MPPHRPGAPLLLSGSRRFVKVEPHFPKLLRRYLGKEEALPPPSPFCPSRVVGNSLPLAVVVVEGTDRRLFSGSILFSVVRPSPQ